VTLLNGAYGLLLFVSQLCLLMLLLYFIIGAVDLVVPNIAAAAAVAVLLLLVIVVVSKFWCPMRLLSLPLLLSPVFLQQ
jgi:hypothetical protein